MIASLFTSVHLHLFFRGCPTCWPQQTFLERKSGTLIKAVVYPFLFNSPSILVLTHLLLRITHSRLSGPLTPPLPSQVWLTPHFAGSHLVLSAFSLTSQGVSLPPLLHCVLLCRVCHCHHYFIVITVQGVLLPHSLVCFVGCVAAIPIYIHFQGVQLPPFLELRCTQ